MGNSGEENLIYLNPGDGDFSEVPPIPIGDEKDDTRSVLVVDIDGNGEPDVIVGNGPGEMGGALAARV